MFDFPRRDSQARFLKSLQFLFRCSCHFLTFTAYRRVMFYFIRLQFDQMRSLTKCRLSTSQDDSDSISLRISIPSFFMLISKHFCSDSSSFGIFLIRYPKIQNDAKIQPLLLSRVIQISRILVLSKKIELSVSKKSVKLVRIYAQD